MLPNADTAQPATPEYIADLIKRTGKSAAWCARRVGVTDRYLRKLTAGHANASYPVQFALESLAAEMERVAAAKSMR